MNHRALMLCIHGLASNWRWFDPFRAHIERLGVETLAEDMPGLERSGPESWVERIVTVARTRPVILLGHSLGAVAALAASRRVDCRAVVRLAIPPFSREFRAALVTNGILATRERLDALSRAGLDVVTFSIDSADAAQFARLRGGADLRVVERNLLSAPAGLARSVFAIVSRNNADALPGVVELAWRCGLPAVAVSAPNFRENAGVALLRGAVETALDAGIAHAARRGVMLIGPWMHNVPDVGRALRYCRVWRSSQLIDRPEHHTHCLSPWRTAVLSVSGVCTPCNCAPDVSLGSLAKASIDRVHNGPMARRWREAMVGACNPHCLVCPRY